ncbi:MAG TPA: CBS domain-containing protein [Thermopolyspora sp.]|jgi:Predicted signal-transduction protein containing cAMP-binding and CBS domains
MSGKNNQMTVRGMMHPGAQCVGENESVQRAAVMMRDLGVGALPICGTDDRLKGIITDRDIVIKCCAGQVDLTKVTVGEFAHGIVWIDVNDSADKALQTMEQHRIKRLPVIENHRIVGMISEADLARSLPEHKLAEFVSSVYARG